MAVSAVMAHPGGFKGARKGRRFRSRPVFISRPIVQQPIYHSYPTVPNYGYSSGYGGVFSSGYGGGFSSGYDGGFSSGYGGGFSIGHGGHNGEFGFGFGGGYGK